MDKQIEKLSSELVQLGQRMITNSFKTKDKHNLKVGNLLQLVGAIINDEEDTISFDEFVSYFSAKKIVEVVSPETLYLAKRIGDSPQLKGLVEGFLESLSGSDDCDTCPSKDTCTDKHCAKPDATDEAKKPVKRRKKPAPLSTRKRKPKNE